MAVFDDRYPLIADYAMLSDCHCAALVSRSGSIDWCCMPRMDDDSLFGRLLDWGKGGFFSIAPEEAYQTSRRYLPGTMVLETRLHAAGGEAVLLDFFAMDDDPIRHPAYDLVRIVECVSGEISLEASICPRFDYGEIRPRMRRRADGVFVATGSDKGLIIWSDSVLEVVDHCDLGARIRLRAGERRRFRVQFQFPELIEATVGEGLPDASRLDAELEQTIAWWSQWSANARRELDEQSLRSAIVLKALTFERTGAIAAAATTSLPETPGGTRNWDYRFSWVRDSVFTVRALHELGYSREAARFHAFIERCTAGDAHELQVMFGVDGKRRLTEIELDWLEGYRKSAPVRIGNRAAKQVQLDIYGELLEMAWAWHENGHQTDPDYWSFLVDVANVVCERWMDRDHGIWEVRKEPQHHVHSKVMCWAALNRAIMLATESGFDAPLNRWRAQRDEIRLAVESRGYDPRRGVFVQAFDSVHLDAALLLLPRVGFIDYRDERMVRTVEAISRDLDRKGLLLRYDSPDNLPGQEGVFLPCTFWLVVCLVHQGQMDRARGYYERALSCANDAGLFSEEFDPDNWEMLGNLPQGLTHVSQIMARLALERGGAPL